MDIDQAGSRPTGQPPLAGGLRPGPLPGLILPSYGGACLEGLAPALMAAPGARPPWLPSHLRTAEQVVLLVLDGLGWLQLQERKALAAVLGSFEGGPMTTVAPSTTATALSSLALGMPPALHGIVGYKFVVSGPTGEEVLNVLRWSTSSGDARGFARPAELQPALAFGGRAVPVVSRGDFAGSGFTQAHQRGAREVGWTVPSSVPVLVRGLVDEGEQFVYAYYDGIDKVAHAAGFGPLYDAEVAAADRLVGDLLSALPERVALAVTADHGQVLVGTRAAPVVPEVAALCKFMSGEGRFRWLHALPGRVGELLEAARGAYGGRAWVASRQDVLAAGVLGGEPSVTVLARLGDVALVPLGEEGFLDPRDPGDARLVCRHGGLSPGEMLVPLLCS
ncbi:MAG TPA: alkaline phosphatase family protein [Acidimicrobiales bacterium]|nr:alkaline phosphatase family protein [Acidimicrobiales bacterium]